MSQPPGFERLRAQIAGKVLYPQDRGYDDARMSWNKNIDQRPAVIIKPQTVDDIISAIRQAHKWAMPVAVQNTGHGAMLPCDGAMLVDTSALTNIRIDATRKIARVAPGVTWGALMEAAARFGLAGPAGFNATVGVVGYSLGGGYGWLSRQYGLATDHIVGANLVLADGSIRSVNAEEDSELLWALRGGGGDIGVVTAMEIGLVPLARVYGGSLIFPLERARELLQLFADTTRNADTRLTTAIRMVRPPTDGVLSKLFGGQPTVTAMLCFLGDEAEGEAMTQAWRTAGPKQGRLKVIEVSGIGEIEGPPPKGAMSVQMGEQLRIIDAAAIETLVSEFERDRSPIFLTELRHAGGEIRQHKNAAYDRRSGEYLLHLEAAAGDEFRRAFARNLLDGIRSALEPVLSGDAAIGFVGDGEEGLAAMRRAYSDASTRRLTIIKNHVDPQNQFPFNISARLQGMS